MFGSLGVPELLLVFAVALIVFGPRKLPEIGRTIGRALGEFRRATDDLKSTIEREVEVEELKKIESAMTTPLEAVSRDEQAEWRATVSAGEPAESADQDGGAPPEPEPKAN